MRTFEKRGSKTKLLRIFENASKKSLFYPYYGAGLHATGTLGTPCMLWCKATKQVWNTKKFLVFHGIPKRVWDVFSYIYMWEGNRINRFGAEAFGAKTPVKFVRYIKAGADLDGIVEKLIRKIQTKYGWDPEVYPPNWYESHIANENYGFETLVTRLTSAPGLKDPELKDFITKNFFRLLKTA